MSKFLKQFVFVSLAIAILMIGGLVIYSATPGGNLKINPILGHDLDLNGLYYAQAGNNTVHDITTQDISISAWVKVDADSGLSGIFSKYNSSSGNGYVLYVNSTGVIRWLIRDGTDQYYVAGTTNIKDDKWHYISGIIDRSDTSQCKIFLDGVDNTASRSGTLANVDSITSTVIPTLGVYFVNTLSSILDGQIRDVKLYYAAGDHWSDAQVLYQAQHPFDYTANAGTLTDYWRLDEGSGTTLYGKVNNLTLSNVLAWTTQPKIKMVKQENTTTTGNNPVGWWKMDEGTASSSYDSSGNGNTGTLTGGVQWATGKLGKGLKFDGVNDYVSVASSTSLNMGINNFSYGLWFNSSDLTQTYFLAKGSGNYWAIRNGWDNIGRITCAMLDTTWKYIENPVNTNDGRWHYVMCVKDTLTTFRMYVDGKFVNSNTLSGDGDLSNTGDLFIGADWLGTQWGREIIDDVRIYNRALTAGEVAQMYNSTKDGYLGNIKVSTGLVGYWKLDDNNALTSVIDYSGKGNNGTAYFIDATSTSVLSTSTAMVGRAMSFDGVGRWVQVANNANLNFGTKSFTVSFWAKPSVLGLTGWIVGKNAGAINTSGWFMRIDTDNTIMQWVKQVGTTQIYQSSTATLNTSSFSHIVGVFNRESGNLILYVNGAWNKTTSIASLTNSFDHSNSLYISSNNATNFYFNGLIDEVKIWNYARTAEQIKNDYVLGTKHREE